MRGRCQLALDALLQLCEAEAGEVQVVGSGQQARGGCAEFGLEFAQEGAGRKDDQRTEAALLGLLLQMVGQLARKSCVLLLLCLLYTSPSPRD